MLSRFSRVSLFVTPWTVAHQAPLSMGFSRQEYWSGLLCPPSGDLPDLGIEPASPALAGEVFTTSTTWKAWVHSLVQSSSVAQLCLIVCDTMDCSTPGFSVHHQLLGLAQTHVHQVGDTIQPSPPLSSPFPSAFDLAKHQGLFQWVSSLHQVAKVLGFQLHHQSFQ